MAKKAKKLTAAESKWLDDLEAVMSRCPTARLQCYTTGDCDLTFYDKDHAEAWEDAQPRRVELDAGELHEKAGSILRAVTGSFCIDSCAG